MILGVQFRRLIGMILGVQFRALLFLASADLALVLVGLVLVDLLTDILGHRLAYLFGLGLVVALVGLEPVAAAGVLRPDLAAVAVLLPELLAGLLLLRHAFLLEYGRVRAFLMALDVTLGLELLDVFDLLDRLAMVDAVRAILCVHGRGDGRGHGEAEDESKRPHDDGVLFGE